jgi:hypothetical protein
MDERPIIIIFPPDSTCPKTCSGCHLLNGQTLTWTNSEGTQSCVMEREMALNNDFGYKLPAKPKTDASVLVPGGKSVVAADSTFASGLPLALALGTALAIGAIKRFVR